VFLKHIANLLGKNQNTSSARRIVCVLWRYDKHAIWV